MHRSLVRGLQLLLGEAPAKGFAFAAYLLGARLLGPTAFGAFASAYAVVGVALALSDFGLTPYLTRTLSQKAPTAGSTFWSVTCFNLSLSVVVYCTMVAVVCLVWPSVGPAIAVYGLVLPLQAFTTSLDSLLLSMERAPQLALARFSANAVLLLLVLGGLLLRATTVVLAAAFVGAAIVRATLQMAFVRSEIPARAFSLRHTLTILKGTVAFALAGLIGFLYFRVDVILLGVLKSQHVVGIYAGAFRIVEGLMLVPVAVVAVLFPSWARRSVTFTDASQVLRVLLAAGSGLAFAFALAGTIVVRVLLGTAYGGSVVVFRILLLGLPVIFIDVALVWMAYARERESKVVWNGVAALVANVVLNLALIPGYGPRGAAAATVLAELVNLLGFVFIFRRELWRRRRILWRSAAYAGAVTGGLLGLYIVALRGGIVAIGAVCCAAAIVVACGVDQPGVTLRRMFRFG